MADPSQAVVPGATVTVSEIATGRAIPLTTNDVGRYSARNLPPGLYTIRIEASGFSSVEISDVSVSAGSAVNEDVTLKLGPVQETVSVSASAVVVDNARHTVDTVITGKEIRNIPLFSRNFLDLAALAPGVQVRDAGAIFPLGIGRMEATRAVGISGRSGIGTRVQIDGIDVTGAFGGSTVANISSDAVQEFQLSRSSLDVSAPMTSSGAISVISRSGGNELHGAWFWDYYNQDMGARLQYNRDAEPFHRNRTGGSAGGRFVKDKLFWFGNAEYTHQTEQLVSSVPEFPQFDISQPAPIRIRYAKGRLDWNLRPTVRLF